MDGKVCWRCFYTHTGVTGSVMQEHTACFINITTLCRLVPLFTCLLPLFIRSLLPIIDIYSSSDLRFPTFSNHHHYRAQLRCVVLKRLKIHNVLDIKSCVSPLSHTCYSAILVMKLLTAVDWTSCDWSHVSVMRPNISQTSCGFTLLSDSM